MPSPQAPLADWPEPERAMYECTTAVPSSQQYRKTNFETNYLGGQAVLNRLAPLAQKCSCQKSPLAPEIHPIFWSFPLPSTGFVRHHDGQQGEGSSNVPSVRWVVELPSSARLELHPQKMEG